mmetsp:Transcript_16101/g.39804  ORF Transcript_16101/g.39804 Transcript_16101/m.39804 type:complete len:228 (+) Transcript_16101:2861-3544(+)
MEERAWSEHLAGATVDSNGRSGDSALLLALGVLALSLLHGFDLLHNYAADASFHQFLCVRVQSGFRKPHVRAGVFAHPLEVADVLCQVRIVEKHLVELPHLEQQHFVEVFRFDFPVLLHHRRHPFLQVLVLLVRLLKLRHEQRRLVVVWVVGSAFLGVANVFRHEPPRPLVMLDRGRVEIANLVVKTVARLPRRREETRGEIMLVHLLFWFSRGCLEIRSRCTRTRR